MATPNPAPKSTSNFNQPHAYASVVFNERTQLDGSRAGDENTIPGSVKFRKSLSTYKSVEVILLTGSTTLLAPDNLLDFTATTMENSGNFFLRFPAGFGANLAAAFPEQPIGSFFEHWFYTASSDNMGRFTFSSQPGNGIVLQTLNNGATLGRSIRLHVVRTGEADYRMVYTHFDSWLPQ